MQLYCQSSAQVLVNTSCKPVSQCHLVTPTGTGDGGNVERHARTISQLTFHHFFHQNSAYGFCSNGRVGGMTQNPAVVTSHKVFHV